MENKRYNVQDVRHVRDALPDTPDSFYDAVERSLAACRSERKERTFAGPRLKKKWLLPLVAAAVLLLGGTAVVEVIFSYPGLGNLAVSSIMAYDYPVIQGYVLWVAVIYMVINLVVDFSYGFIDPRIRLKR